MVYEGAADKKSNFRYFWTWILLNLKVKVPLNSANCIRQKRFHMISVSTF